MTEGEAIKEIHQRCETTDYERNGAELDKIIIAFLQSNGFSELAHSVECVECWRA